MNKINLRHKLLQFVQEIFKKGKEKNVQGEKISQSKHFWLNFSQRHKLKQQYNTFRSDLAVLKPDLAKVVRDVP